MLKKGCMTSQGISEENGIHANGVTQCLEKKNEKTPSTKRGYGVSIKLRVERPNWNTVGYLRHLPLS